MVLIPIDADQPLNAQRCVALGAANAIPPGERTPDAIRDATRTILADPSYRTKAEEVAAETAALPGPEHAVTLLEQLARERRPLPAPAA
jgi:UDP:flavonoid glycosyltransferase YjiC (YdhE family)